MIQRIFFSDKKNKKYWHKCNKLWNISFSGIDFNVFQFFLKSVELMSNIKATIVWSLTDDEGNGTNGIL